MDIIITKWKDLDGLETRINLLYIRLKHEIDRGQNIILMQGARTPVTFDAITDDENIPGHVKSLKEAVDYLCQTYGFNIRFGSQPQHTNKELAQIHAAYTLEYRYAMKKDDNFVYLYFFNPADYFSTIRSEKLVGNQEIWRHIVTATNKPFELFFGEGLKNETFF